MSITAVDVNQPQPAVIASAASPHLAPVAKVIKMHYRPEIWQGVKAALAVTACLSLKQSDHCVVLIFEGGSGQGKSLTLRLVSPDRPQTEKVLERVDNFTQASFVSHASNRTRQELDKIDLLPRIKGKTMVTKELAPLFRGPERNLCQNFACITSVLDGDGYKTNSGTHGDRGYEGRYVFNWLGATTPIPESTHRIMAQLGNRLLFYEVAGEELTEADLVKFAQNYDAHDTMELCRKSVNDFIDAYFQARPVASIDPKSISISESLTLQIVRYAQLIANGRMEISWSDFSCEFQPGMPEDPHRVILLLQMIARGLALIEGRSEVTAADLEVIRHIAFSSIPQQRRVVLRAVIEAGGSLDSDAVERAIDRSRPTALKRMEELGTTHICVFTPGKEQTSTPARITLGKRWEWLLPAETIEQAA